MHHTVAMHLFRYLVGPALLLSSAASAVSDLVKLDYAKYKGYSTSSGISAWLGMRYAAPPLNELRFMPPQDPPESSCIHKAQTVSAL